METYDRVTAENFGALVKQRFPELSTTFEEQEGIDHLTMSDLYRHVAKLAGSGMTDELNSALRLVEELFLHGDDYVKNMVNVSFLEYITLTDITGHTIWAALPPTLQKEWQELQVYFAAMEKEYERRRGLDEE